MSQRAGEDPLPVKEPDESLGGRRSVHTTRLGFVRTLGSAETLSLITLSRAERAVKGRNRGFGHFPLNWHGCFARQKRPLLVLGKLLRKAALR
jgi:hypothetical protein